MSSLEHKQDSIRSNADLIALALIIIFAVAGSAATSWIGSLQPGYRWMPGRTVPDVVRPHIVEIRNQTRQAALQVRTDIRNEVSRAQQEFRGTVCEMRKDMREAEKGRHELRDELHRWRDDFRRETREFFRQFRGR